MNLTRRVSGNCRGAQPTSQDTIGHISRYNTHLDLTGSVIIPELFVLVVGLKPTEISVVIMISLGLLSLTTMQQWKCP